ncbi:uncharacterized protein B0I36DRAFT_367355 [Microdochium trichocladiopsis]|uniref:RING-type domain-containing protein n=1 Tax=Microdochium trichocladiopsis TaxID=1682393 RepID=A0A9P8XYJ3_9PEZI|nr:uncharacterized protein B0I36DRAFT_367355 [Microdochium trichocladiopsis]KAH7020874.1 hypothetical protein B0I36DRAFT_367355 [Microdochium trichocladiopsis]
MAGAASPPTDTPSTDSPSASGPLISPDATKMALALSVIFILCIFGTAFGARRYIRRGGFNLDHQHQQSQLQHRYYYYRHGSASPPSGGRFDHRSRRWRGRARGQLQMVELPLASHYRLGLLRNRDVSTSRRLAARKGLAADKIGRFPVVEFRHEDFVLVGKGERLDPGFIAAVAEPDETRDSPQQHPQQEHQSQPPSSRTGGMLSLETFPTLSKAVASLRSRHHHIAGGPERNEQLQAAEPSSPLTRISCSICTDDFVEGVRVRRLPCGHVFHPGCLDPWLRDRARTCPLW